MKIIAHPPAGIPHGTQDKPWEDARDKPLGGSYEEIQQIIAKGAGMLLKNNE
jgi:hypothetical protein